MQNDVLKQTSDYSAALKEIDKKYDDQLEKLGMENKALIEQARQGEKFSTIMDEISKTYDRLNGYQKTFTDLQKAQIEAASKSGAINSVQKQMLDNAMLKREQEQLQAQIEQNNSKVAGYKRQKDSLGTGVNTSGIDQQIDDLNDKTMQLQSQLIGLGNQIKSYGEDIRNGFADNVSSAISGILTDASHAQNVLMSLGKGLQKTFADLFAKNAASVLTTDLSKWSAGRSKDGQDVFSKMGSLFGLGQKVQLGENPSKALYVRVTNLGEMLGGLYQGGGSTFEMPSFLKSNAIGNAASSFLPRLFNWTPAQKSGNAVVSGLAGLGLPSFGSSHVDYGTGITQKGIGTNFKNAFGALTGLNPGLLLQSIATPKGLPASSPSTAAGVTGDIKNIPALKLNIHPDFAKMTLDDWFRNQLAGAYAGR